MEDQNALPGDGGLRVHAERHLHAFPRQGTPYIQNTVKLIHELQVHEVELELQNELLAEALAEADALRRKYQELYEFAPVGYLTLNENGEITESNQRALAMLGKSASTVLGRPLLHFMADAAIPLAREFFAGALQTPEEIRIEHLQLKRKSVLPLYVNIQARSLMDPVSKHTSIHIAMMDVTALSMAVDDVVLALTQAGT